MNERADNNAGLSGASAIEERILSCVGITKSYHDSDNRKVAVFRDLDLGVGEGEIVSIVGPSGCGKTTLLRLIAGLESWEHGSIEFRNQHVTGPDKDRGFIFQSYSSFPWLTVQENILFGLRLAHNRDAIRLDVNELIGDIGLAEFSNFYPGALSGGMKQRIAIARALALKPKLLLMDEPFGALDVQTRHRIQMLVLQIWKKYRLSIILVTHDLEEAVFLADRVVVFGPRPLGIRRNIAIDLPRPRNHDTRRRELFMRYKIMLSDEFQG